jgi:hypothetical protein
MILVIRHVEFVGVFVSCANAKKGKVGCIFVMVELTAPAGFRAHTDGLADDLSHENGPKKRQQPFVSRQQVVAWIAIRLVLILSILLCWHTRQIDFVLAYPQAPLETPLFMEIPKGITMQGLP